MTLTTSVSPDPAAGVIVMELHGLLDISSVPSLRTVLLKALTHDPDAVVVDVSGLRVETRSHLAVFPAAVRTTGGDAAVLLLCGADEDLRSMMRGGILGGLATYGDCRAALSAVAAAEVPGIRRTTLRLAATAAAPGLARRLVTNACTAWGLEGLIGPAGLVISELVSNAVQHAGTEMILRVTRGASYLHLDVHDGSSRRPQLTTGQITDDGSLTIRGRGLHLVDAYATAWGSTVDGNGKTVWATMRLPEAG